MATSARWLRQIGRRPLVGLAAPRAGSWPQTISVASSAANRELWSIGTIHGPNGVEGVLEAAAWFED
jgi:hypothetical protein